MSHVDDATILDLDMVLGETPPDECAHIVQRQGSLGAGALIRYAYENQLVIRALCGFEWTPRWPVPPDDLPACRRCVEMWQALTNAGAGS